QGAQGLAACLARAQIHLGLNEMAPAERALREALRLSPDHPEALNNLASLLGGQHRFLEARELLSRLLAMTPDHAAGLANLARIERRLARPDRALAAIARLRKVAEGAVEADLLEGLCRMDLGQNEQARDCLERALGVKPHLTEALEGLAQITRARPGDRLIARITQALEQPGLNAADSALLHYAAAKYHDDTGHPEAAIRSAMAAKAACPAPFDIDAQEARVDRMIDAFDECFFAIRAGYGEPSEVPVFVLGMPRSGTTLAEQVIASHPDAQGAGELPFFQGLARQLGFAGPDPDAFIAQCKALSKADTQVLARAYLEDVRERFPAALRVVDKMPHNFEQIWLIRLLFPRARIIHCTRDAADTCLSIFMHHFSQAHAYAQELGLLGRYYRSHERLMAHWRSVLPGALHTHGYEEMVTDPEAAIRALLAACGLPFDEACLAYHKTPRAVMTFSRWQVRQPVYTSSVARWQRYQPWIGALLAALSK
ncbi:MAG: sulfotransferase, partial [Aestuariivirgaceae bacterium]|nr:sulfotransferase [Aestuariivirgaceae bacterium]